MANEKAILVRYGEVWLKSESVRHRFAQTLVDNIRVLFPRKTKISAIPGRIWVYCDSIPAELKRVFGIVSFSPVIICDKSTEAMTAAATPIVSKWKSGTFAIRARRSDKSFPLTSKQLEIALANLVDLPVDLSSPEHELCVEIRDKAYLYDKTIAGPGGLPLGTAGKVAAKLRDDDDLAAAWLVMKRGALPILIKPSSALLRTLQRWSIGKKLRAAKSLKEAAKLGAIALVDARSKRPKAGGLATLNPLAGFSAAEKAQLLKKIRA
ncbi:MAG: THUMP domain-containing protein [Candidatus Aenigmatarchaeota archaeon]